MSLQIFSTKDPNRPIEKMLDAAQVQRTWQDFEVYRQLQMKGAETAER